MHNITDIVKLAISHLEKDAHIWWQQLAVKSTDYEQGHLGQNKLKGEIETAFSDVDRELKLYWQLSALRHTASIASYTKEFVKLPWSLGTKFRMTLH